MRWRRIFAKVPKLREANMDELGEDSFFSQEARTGQTFREGGKNSKFPGNVLRVSRVEIARNAPGDLNRARKSSRIWRMAPPKGPKCVFYLNIFASSRLFGKRRVTEPSRGPVRKRPACLRIDAMAVVLTSG